MTTSGGHKGFLQQALTEHVGLKVLALVASIGLFVIVRGTEDAQISLAVDVVAILPPQTTNRMLVSEIPDEVRITLRGSRSVLNTVRREGLPPIQMDLHDTRTHFYYFEAGAFDVPAGANIMQIAPSAVPLRWVERADRRVRIEPLLEGDPAPGNAVVSTSVEPGLARVRGAASQVHQLETVHTAAVEISGMTAGRHELRVPLGSLPEHVAYVDSVAVNVTVTIEEEQVQRTMAQERVEILNASGSVRPPTVDVLLTGPRVRVNAIPEDRVVPFVDLNGVEPGRGARRLTVQVQGVPDGVTATAQPPEVIVHVQNR